MVYSQDDERAGTSLGERIGDLRRARRPRLTQEELAAAAYVSVDVIAKLEQGRKQGARLETVQRIARALGVTVGDLLDELPPGGQR